MARVVWRKRWIAVAMWAAIGLLGTGCQGLLSSSNSSSQGIGSSSSVSGTLLDSGSSLASPDGDGQADVALERDVSAYTALFARSGGDLDAYLHGVATLGETYGVSHWQRDPVVRRGIAGGLARSALSERQIGDFARRVAGEDGELSASLLAAATAMR